MSARVKQALLAGSLLVLAPGEAEAGWVKICVEYDVLLYDADPSIGDDFWTTNAPKPARGMQIRLTNESSGSNNLHYLLEDGPDAGCLSRQVYLNPANDYTVTLRTRARVQSNFVAVRPEGHPNLVHGSNVAVPGTTSGTLTLTSPADPQWSLMAAAAYALYRQPAGLSGETFTLWNGNLPQYFAGMYDHGPLIGTIIFDGDTRRRKYVIAHELGHAIKFKHMSGQMWVQEDAADGERCPEFQTWSHDMFSREWTSTAIAEGTAHAYAAAVWNRTTDSDCYFEDYKMTDPDRDYVADSQRLHCTGPFQTQSSGMWFSGANYYDEIPCGFEWTHDNNTATAFDWMRFWWAMMSEEGLEFADVAGIFAAADPATWLHEHHYNGNNWPDMPTRRIKWAAYGLGFASEYDAQDHHGVYR